MSEEGAQGFAPPTLSESDGIRYLHFGSHWVQGAMRVGKPSELVLAYTRQMMAWLLLLEPKRSDMIGILGLGAGSLLRFTLRHTPCRVETVERDAQVTAACRAWFRLPGAARSRIVHADADDWVQDPQNHGRFLVLMVDLYDADAQGLVCDSLAFYQGCRNALGEVGIVAVNLFGEHASFARNMENLHAAFGGRMLRLPEVDGGNRVVLALKGLPLPVITGQSASLAIHGEVKRGSPHPEPQVPPNGGGETTTVRSEFFTAAEWFERAEEIETRFGLPARRWAKAVHGDLQSIC